MSARLRGSPRLSLGLGVVLLIAPFGLAMWGPTARWIRPEDGKTRAAMGPTQRALGPLASVAASIEWVRFREALLDGDTTRAYAIAEGALALDPSGEGGWLDYAHHLIFVRGSFAENETPAGRRQWIQAGLDLLERGEAVCRRPGELAFTAGLIRTGYLASIPDEDLGWPGGPEALLEQGTQDLQRAAAAGRTGAVETLTALRAAQDGQASGDK